MRGGAATAGIAIVQSLRRAVASPAHARLAAAAAAAAAARRPRRFSTLAGAPRDAFAATAAEAAATATQGDVVDLRSDTVTKPTPGMLQAMVRADVGDDVYGEDPSVNTLQEYAASLLGTQDALWVPTGTMANIVSVLANCGRGEQVILGSASHVWLWEQHGLSSLGGLALHPLPNDPRTGELHIPDIVGAIHPLDDHLPISRMVLLENSQSGCGGVALTPSYTKEVAHMCKAHGLHLHIDGARLLNAAVALGVPPSDLTEGATSVSVCLSKGVGAPMGSIVAGDAEFVARAKRVRKLLGGGCRQAGGVAAAGLYGLEGHRQVMQQDHVNARRLAEGLNEVPGIKVLSPSLEPRAKGLCWTNMVIFETEQGTVPASLLCERVAEDGILMWPYGNRGSAIRAVTNLGVSCEGITRAIRAVDEAMRR